MSSNSDSGFGLRVAIVTNVVLHYRAEFYRRLFQREDLSVSVPCQAAHAHTARAGALTEWLRLEWWHWFDNVFGHANGEVVPRIEVPPDRGGPA